jgi:hypothetical protein
MKKSLFLNLLAIGATATTASAASVALTAPADIAAALASTSHMDARLRNGGSGYEAALLPGSGANVWNSNFSGGSALVPTVGGAPDDWRNFEINYTMATGVLTLKVDANQSGDFGGAGTNGGAFETLTYDFGTDGFSFKYIDLYYRGSTTTSADAKLRNVVVDGTAQGSFDSGSVNYTDAVFGQVGGGYFGDIAISGQFDFTASSSGEVPSFGVKLRDISPPPSAVSAIPEPASMAALSGFLSCGLFLRSRRKAIN